MPRSRFRLSLRFAWTASLVVAALLVLHLLASPSVADDFARQAARAAVQRYLRELDEIEKVAAERRAEATRRLRKALSESEKFSQKENGKRYRGMLGRYIAHSGPIPFIMLNVPNGDNVLNPYVKSLMNGRIDMNRALYSFAATGHVAVPRDGAYTLEASRGHWDLKLNDLGYALTMIPKHPRNRYAADVQLKAGVYEVKFSVGNNGGQLPEAAIRIVDQATGKDLPIFIYESELEEFHNDLSLGVELIETSKWTREENLLRK